MSELERMGETIFLCEICGFGYRDPETAERCEQYCYAHRCTSVALARKAVHKPRKRVIPTDLPAEASRNQCPNKAVDSLNAECRSAMLISGSHSSLDEFLENFHTYCAVYRRLATIDENAVHSETFSVGNEPNRRIKSWTKRDLQDLLRSKHLHHFFPKIDGSPNLQKHLTHAFRIQEEKARIETLCEIPGIGPALASVILESTCPEMYGALNSHAWNALRLLSFNLSKKRASHDSFTVHELIRYLEIIRRLARERGTTPVQIGKALYAYDKAVTDKRWKRQFALALRRFTTPVLSAGAKGQFTDVTRRSNSIILSPPI